MQKTSRFSRLLTLVTAVALAVCLPVSAYAETETTEEAAAPAVVEEAAQDNTADEAASEDSASCVRVVDVTIFMDTTKGHFESQSSSNLKGIQLRITADTNNSLPVYPGIMVIL